MDVSFPPMAERIFSAEYDLDLEDNDLDFLPWFDRDFFEKVLSRSRVSEIEQYTVTAVKCNVQWSASAGQPRQPSAE
jgi:hypothetical protein